MLHKTSFNLEIGWCNDENRIYITYTVEQVQKDIRCSAQKAIKILKELEKADLIERKRLGQGKPSLIFVKNLLSKAIN